MSLNNPGQAEIVCIDQTISCTAPLHKIASWLPDTFYPIHRSYLVNVIYIVSLCRYEANLLSGIAIPIPARTYMQVRQDIERLLSDEKSL